MSACSDATDTFTNLINDLYRRNVPFVTLRGTIRAFELWQLNDFDALKRTFGKFSHGEMRDEILNNLYAAGLNLPVKYQDDWKLMRDALARHANLLKEMFPSSSDMWISEPLPDVALIYDEELRSILCNV